MKIKSYIIFILMAIIMIISAVACNKNETTLVLKMTNEAILPRAFRTTNSPFKKNIEPLPSRAGLEKLHISGSAQFSEKSFEVIVEKLGNPKPLYIIDLREESHGFLNGNAVTWYGYRNRDNRGKSLEEITAIEQNLLDKALKSKDITLYKVSEKDEATGGFINPKPVPIVVVSSETERSLIERLHHHYIRLPSADHEAPSDSIVDLFITTMLALPKDRWIHFHCSAGVGRTTVFMSMLDMMYNAKDVSFEDIMRRQWLLGGKNLLSHPKVNNWKRPTSEKRTQFMQDFYNYCRYNKDNFITPWSKRGV